MAIDALVAHLHDEPLPNCFSIWPRAISSALSRSTVRLLLVVGLSDGGGCELGTAATWGV